MTDWRFFREVHDSAKNINCRKENHGVHDRYITHNSMRSAQDTGYVSMSKQNPPKINYTQTKRGDLYFPEPHLKDRCLRYPSVHSFRATSVQFTPTSAMPLIKPTTAESTSFIYSLEVIRDDSVGIPWAERNRIHHKPHPPQPVSFWILLSHSGLNGPIIL